MEAGHTDLPKPAVHRAADASLERFAEEKLARLQAQGLDRRLVESERDGIYVWRNGQRLLSFSCNDYLNLSQHPYVKQAAVEAVQRYGTGAGASRLVTGNHPLFSELERRLARLKGTEAACVFGSGYLTNVGVMGALAGPDDLILMDELSHACLWAGAAISRAKLLRFMHNDVDHARRLLAKNRGAFRHCIIATDGVFSMDGDLAPIAELAALAQHYDGWLMTDDAHGVGVLGGGRGSAFAAGSKVEVPLQMGTLSKALGSYGGYVCASRAVIDLLTARARSFVYSTGLPPASVAAALAALDVIEREPDYAALPLKKARAFTALLSMPPAESPIVPIVIGSAEAAMTASARLAQKGFLVAAIRPPTVPEGTSRLRVTFTALHPDGEVERLADAIHRLSR